MNFPGEINCPPYETADGFLATTEGCSHNTCLFCTYFKDQKYLELFQCFEFTPNIVMETDDMPTAQSLSAVGVGISLVPDHLVEAKIYTRRPVYFSIQQPVAKRVVVAAFDKRHPMSKAARPLLEKIKRICD